LDAGGADRGGHSAERADGYAAEEYQGRQSQVEHRDPLVRSHTGSNSRSQGSKGDGLYAVLIYLLVALVAPRCRAGVVAAVAFVVCAVIELAQLTGLSATAVEAVPPLRYVLGTTFQATALVSYALGAALAAVVDRASARRSRSPAGQTA
jgi:hypothetical protein